MIMVVTGVIFLAAVKVRDIVSSLRLENKRGGVATHVGFVSVWPREAGCSSSGRSVGLEWLRRRERVAPSVVVWGSPPARSVRPALALAARCSLGRGFQPAAAHTEPTVEECIRLEALFFFTSWFRILHNYLSVVAGRELQMPLGHSTYSFNQNKTPCGASSWKKNKTFSLFAPIDKYFCFCTRRGPPLAALMRPNAGRRSGLELRSSLWWTSKNVSAAWRVGPGARWRTSGCLDIFPGSDWLSEWQFLCVSSDLFKIPSSASVRRAAGSGAQGWQLRGHLVKKAN